MLSQYLLYLQLNKQLLKGGMQENWFFGITPKAFGAVGAIVNFVVAYVVSKMTKETPQEVQELVDDIRLPNVEEV